MTTQTPALPPSVQKQVDTANAIIEQIKVQQAAQAGGEPAPIDGTPPAPHVTPVAQTTEPPVTTPPAEPQPQHDATYWENRFKVVEGKYRAEVPRLQQQLKETSQQIELLTAQIESLKSAAPPVPQERKLTEEEIREYGPELVDLIGRRAQEIYDAEMDKLKQEIVQLKTQLGNVTQATQQEVHAMQRSQTIDALHKAVPEYKDINRDPRFIEWLDQIDPFSGVKRGTMLAQAVEQNDSERVIVFFKSFKQESAPAAPVTGSQQGTPRHSLADMVSPSAAASSVAAPGTGAQTVKRIWTPDLIAKFYADVQKGRFRGREAEKVAIEREIVGAFSARRAVS